MLKSLWLALAINASGCAVAGLATGDASSQQVDASRSDAGNVTGTDGNTSGCAFSGVLATWNISSGTGSQTSTPASSTATGVVAGDISRSSGLTPATGAGSINSSTWPTSGSLDPSRYYTMSVAPPSGCSLALTSASIDAKASGSGPASGAIATSADGFGQTSNVSTSAASSPALSVTGETSSVEVRVYGYGATSTAGTLRIESTLTLSGRID
jgi:hypothetical protein